MKAIITQMDSAGSFDSEEALRSRWISKDYKDIDSLILANIPPTAKRQHSYKVEIYNDGKLFREPDYTVVYHPTSMVQKKQRLAQLQLQLQQTYNKIEKLANEVEELEASIMEDSI